MKIWGNGGLKGENYEQEFEFLLSEDGKGEREREWRLSAELCTIENVAK